MKAKKEERKKIWNYMDLGHEQTKRFGKSVVYNYPILVLCIICFFFAAFTAVASAEDPPCACGDICVNETGWWRDGGDFNPCGTPIQSAVDNATAGETICVNDGIYNENVDVHKQLTIRSTSGNPEDTIVNAPDANDHVFEVTANWVNISGFTVQNATAVLKAGIYLGNGVEHCYISDNNATNNYFGICLWSSDNNNVTSNTCNSNGNSGIYLEQSNSNTVSDNVCNQNTWEGIWLDQSNNNAIYNNAANLNNRGIDLEWQSNDNTVTNNTCNSNNMLGISLLYWNPGNNNFFADNTASDNTEYNFYSHEDAYNNTVEDLTIANIASYPTTISFTYANGVGLKGVETAPGDPAGKANISKFVNATNVTADSWIFLNVSYRDADLDGVDEDSLRMWRYNGTDWTGVPASNGVNTVENYVYANITSFSIFAPLGDPSGGLNCTCGDICVNETGWWRAGGAFNANGTSIQAAVNNANAGETICVKDGAYTENVNVNVNHLTIRSENGSANCIVSASDSTAHVFDVTADYVNISGLTVKGANESPTAGICLYSAEHCNISDNTASNNRYGIFLYTSSNYNTLTNNTANSNKDCGIYLYPSSNYNTLTNNTANSNNVCGIYLHSSSNYNTLTNNNANSNNCYGICLYSSSYNTLTGNTANSNNWYGIYLWSSSNNNTLTNNTANSNNNPYGDGIYLRTSSNNTLTSNTANSNNHYGIYLDYSSNNTLTNNTANSNNWYGIMLNSQSNSNKLTSNTASNNDYGIYLWHSSNNRIYNNYFNNTHNAYDNGNNVWNITKTAGTNIIGGNYLGGNYWSDYAGRDINGDGLGDTLLPYNSSGSITTGGDWHPLTTVGYAPPNITSFAPPSPVNDTVCTWRTFDVTVNQTVNVSWYLTGSLLFTNESVREASCTLHADVPGEHNVSAIASNANGSDMQTWIWNVTKAADLVITGKWLCWPDNCTICYNVTNIGNGTAPACHNTTLYVDGVAVAHDHVPVDLAPGESYIGCFGDYTWTYTPPSDNITVCADNNEAVVELDEDNNCLTNIWMCGDVNCDGKVTMSDVRKVFNRYLDPNYPLDPPWAADVNCDGKITMSDVRKVFNRYLDPGYELNCCCESEE